MILVLGGVLRLIAAALAPHPGISDPNHYYNLARSLAAGRGFVIDYIWQYHNPPLDITHPIDYWMPLPALWPALGLWLVPDSLLAALLPSVIFGTLIAVLAYAVAAAGELDEPGRLLAMLGVVALPEFVLNSARTDTTLSYVLFAGMASLCFYHGLRGRGGWLLLAGMFAGLTQLSRQDGIILAPALLLALLVHWRWSDRPIPWRWLILLPLGWLLVLAPWLLRNLEVLGVLMPSGASRTLFMTRFTDQFTYGRELTLEAYLAWGWPNIIRNWLVQAAANVKMSYTLLDVGLPVTALAGLIFMLWRRQRERLLLLALPLSMALGLFLFYSFVTPFHTQGGSFKKSFMLLIPFLAYASAWFLRAYLPSVRAALVLGVLMAGFMLLNAVELVRSDFALLRAFNQSVIDLDAVLQAEGDVNGDGEIVIMTQDPFMLNYHGYRALMIPDDPRDLILEAAQRYAVDYILLPAGRQSLDALYDNAEPDARLRWIDTGARYQLLALDPEVDG